MEVFEVPLLAGGAVASGGAEDLVVAVGFGVVAVGLGVVVVPGVREVVVLAGLGAVTVVVRPESGGAEELGALVDGVLAELDPELTELDAEFVALGPELVAPEDWPIEPEPELEALVPSAPAEPDAELVVGAGSTDWLPTGLPVPAVLPIACALADTDSDPATPPLP